MVFCEVDLRLAWNYGQYKNKEATFIKLPMGILFKKTNSEAIIDEKNV